MEPWLRLMGEDAMSRDMQGRLFRDNPWADVNIVEKNIKIPI